MPIYDYGCKACGHEFEREQRISDKPIKKCPACGKLQARRLISRTSFVLKGSGWYSDLYSSGKPGGAAEAEGAGTKKDAEAKPAETAPKTGTKKSSKKKSGGGKEAA